MPKLGGEYAPQSPSPNRPGPASPVNARFGGRSGTCCPWRLQAGRAFLLRTAPTSSSPTESSHARRAAMLGQFGLLRG